MNEKMFLSFPKEEKPPARIKNTKNLIANMFH